MNAIEFQVVAHDGVLDIPPEHRRLLDGKTVRVVLVDSQAAGADGNESLFARLRRVRSQGPADLPKLRGNYIQRHHALSRENCCSDAIVADPFSLLSLNGPDATNLRSRLRLLFNPFPIRPCTRTSSHAH
jgi:hypothetical protein